VKVAIVGGGGRVGSCVAYALQCGGIVSDIILNDIADVCISIPTVVGRSGIVKHLTLPKSTT
jgi:malate/lactate dehydrogenase